MMEIPVPGTGRAMMRDDRREWLVEDDGKSLTSKRRFDALFLLRRMDDRRKQVYALSRESAMNLKSAILSIDTKHEPLLFLWMMHLRTWQITSNLIGSINNFLSVLLRNTSHGLLYTSIYHKQSC